MLIGAQLFTLRDYCKNKTELDESLAKVSSFGYTTVQVSGIGPIAPQDVRELCDKYGLKVAVTHTNPVRLLEDTGAVIREHKQYGCDCVGIGGMPGQYTQSGLAGYRQFLQDYKPVSQMLRENGMTFHYHNHDFEFEKFDGKRGFDVLIEESDPELLYFTLDTYWVQHGGASPLEYVERLNGRIKVLHLKDFAIRDRQIRMAAIGAGNLNWDAILPAAERTGVVYAMVEQDTDFVDDPFSELERSYAFLAGKGLR